MTVFKTYFKIMKKNSRSMLLYILIFVVIAVGITVSSYKEGIKTDINSNIRISVVNLDKDNEKSQELKAYLESKFKPVKVNSDDRSIKESLLSSYVDYVLKIDKGGQLRYYINKDQGKSFMVNQKAMEYLACYDLMDKYRFEGMKEADKILNEKIDIDYLAQSRDNKDKKNNMYGYYNVTSYIVFTVLMIGSFVGQSAFNSQKISDRIRMTKITSKKLNLNLFFASLMFVAIVWLIFFLLAVGLFGKAVFSQYGMKFVIASLLYLVPTSAMSYLFANLSKNPAVNTGITNMLGLLFSFISGVFIPLKYVPSFIEIFAIVSPMYWNNKIYSAILDSSTNSHSILVYVFIQVLIGIACLFITLVIKNKRMEIRAL